MKKFLIALLLGATCTTMSAKAIYGFAPQSDSSNRESTTKSSNQFTNISNLILTDFKSNLSTLKASNNVNINFLFQEVPIFKATVYLSAAIQGYIQDEQLIDIAEDIVEEDSGVIKESQIFINNYAANEKIDAAANDKYLKDSKVILDKLVKNLDSLDKNASNELSYINQMELLIEGSKELADVIIKYTSDDTIKKIAADIVNNADYHLKSLREIKPAFK